jgi:4-aminobutyrate aminotransferase-like enzyme/Ser/Thr protein kinase RdoA (MazF antagonist)
VDPGFDDDVLLAAPPRFTIERAQDLAARRFGIEGPAILLESERDQNFRIDGAGRGSFLLKLSNAAETETGIDYETEALLHIRAVDPGLPIVEPIPTLDGGYWTKIAARGGATHFARAFTFLDGRHAEAHELDLDAIAAFGATLARVGRALRGFFHPGGGRWLLWDEKNALDLRLLLTHVADEERRKGVEHALDLFQDRALPVLPTLRAQSIHNDLTLDNALLGPGDRVTGIVDFGDLAHTALVIEISTAITSLLRGRDDPFDAIAALLEGYGSVTPLEAAELDVLPYLFAARLCALIAIASWRVRYFPDNEAYIMESVEPAWELLEWIDDAGYTLAETRPEPSTRELVAQRARVLGPALARLSYRRPLHLVRGDGVWLFDADGRRYLDAYNNVPVVGHAHPRVTEAIARQARLLNTNLRYLHENAVVLGERLCATMPEGLDTVMFVNSGSEANDLAWRIATAATGGTGAIVTEFAYHGVTTAIADFSPEEWTAPAPTHVATIPAPDGYVGPYRRDEPGWVERYAAHLSDAAAELAARGHPLAAVYLDAGLTSDGILTPPSEYIRALLSETHETGGLFVADEVQTGFGRCGRLWGFELHGIVPDIVTLGKPMGNGHPIAAVIARREIVERFADTTEFFSTFGGNPVACAAGLAVLDVVENEGIVQRAASVGTELGNRLRDLQHPAIGEVRGRGLLIGVAFVEDGKSREPAPALAEEVANGMRERGVLVGRTGPHENVLKIRPPLAFEAEHIDVVVEALEASLPR